MSNPRKLVLGRFAFLVVLMFSLSGMAYGSGDILSRWSKTREFTDPYGSSYSIKVTYYSGEFIEALVAEEAEKNLWTSDELENYKYELVKSLQLDEFIPVMFSFENKGPSMHMAPFDSHVHMWVGKTKYSPADYDRRLNFRVDDSRDGLVFFPRYDEKTGKSLLEGVSSVRLVVSGNINSLTAGDSYDFVWDVGRDNPEALSKGQAAERLEADRLIRRLQKLNAQKAELEEQMKNNVDEIATIEARLAELQGK